MPLAALHYPKGVHADDLLNALVRELQAQGVRVAGTLQRWLCTPGDPCTMELILLPSGETLPLSQPLGRHAQTCRLDPSALAEAAAHVRQQLHAQPRPDLIVFSKFGELEAQGRGFRDEIALALDRGFPVLTAVADVWRADWEAFTGGFSEALPPQRPALLAWCRKVGVLR